MPVTRKPFCQVTLSATFIAQWPFNVHVSSALQLASQPGVFGGSHVSPFFPSVMPSPQKLTRHCDLRHVLPFPQSVPSTSVVPGAHFLPPPAPLTAVHFSVPSQGSLSSQSVSLEQVSRQSASQPSPSVVLPSSHCSPAFLVPSPHVPSVQTPSLQVAVPPVVVHALPFWLESALLEH